MSPQPRATGRYLDPHDPRPAPVYDRTDAAYCRKVANDLRAQRCWHAPGTPGRRALEHNIETNEFIADRIDRELGTA